MPEELVIQTNGPHLRVVLPDFETDWAGVAESVEFELEEGIERAEVVAPCYPDDDCLDGVRELIERLEQLGVEAIVEWQGIPSRERVGASSVQV